MKWLAEYIKDKNYVCIVAEGKFTAEDQLKMMEDVSRREYWQPGLNVLCDFRKLEFDIDSLAAIREASANRQKNEAKIGSGKSALLMNSLADYGRGRQYQLLTESKVSAQIRVFTDENEALDWLLGQ
jgi:hypothetical protein